MNKEPKVRMLVRYSYHNGYELLDYAAIITMVYPDRAVGLHVMPPILVPGGSFTSSNCFSIAYVPFSPEPKDGHWSFD